LAFKIFKYHFNNLEAISACASWFECMSFGCGVNLKVSKYLWKVLKNNCETNCENLCKGLHLKYVEKLLKMVCEKPLK
jgi:hypothetical protein